MSPQEATFQRGRKVRRAARGYTVSVDTAFAKVLAGCVRQHGENWIGLVSPLFRDMHANPSSGVRMHSFELWRDDELVAGEIGSTCGASYCSFTGFRTANGSGRVQMACTCALLRAKGYSIWDLGMGLDYKYALGAEDVPRTEFLRRFRAVRDGSGCGPLSCAPRSDAHALLQADAKVDVDAGKRPQ